MQGLEQRRQGREELEVGQEQGKCRCWSEWEEGEVRREWEQGLRFWWRLEQKQRQGQEQGLSLQG